MKRVFSIVISLLLVFVLSASVTSAGNTLAPTGDKVVFTDDNWAYEKNNGYGYELDEYIGSASEVSLPWSFAKEYITAVGDYAFQYKSAVTSVNTTSVIERIGDYAFNFCSSLQSINLYDSLKTLGEASFYGDSSLTNINLEDTSITAVPSYCFAECGFSEVALPDSCVKIDSFAFYRCSLLEKITIPESVTEISDSAFTGCDNIVIYCYTDSYAHQYSEANNIDFVLLDSQQTSFILGDADNSGNVDIVDATFIQRFVNHVEVPIEADVLMHGDVDGNGELDAVDVTFIMRHIVRVATPYPIGEEVTR